MQYKKNGVIDNILKQAFGRRYRRNRYTTAVYERKTAVSPHPNKKVSLSRNHISCVCIVKV